jgi:uncharacterized pyridoxal phosphate-containing UPF0001 family protein
MRLRVLLEVNLGREPQKHGFLEEELPEALARVRERCPTFRSWAS